jgi:hypothetical protein
MFKGAALVTPFPATTEEIGAPAAPIASWFVVVQVAPAPSAMDDPKPPVVAAAPSAVEVFPLAVAPAPSAVELATEAPVVAELPTAVPPTPLTLDACPIATALDAPTPTTTEFPTTVQNVFAAARARAAPITIESVEPRLMKVAFPIAIVLACRAFVALPIAMAPAAVAVAALPTATEFAPPAAA